MRMQMPRFRFKDPNKDPKKRKQDFKRIQDRRKKKKVTDTDEIEKLRKRLWPAFGEEKEEIPTSDIQKFTDLPLSKKTLQGLTAMKFSKPTDIQREALMYALKGHDILGAAKTGSGKTLAFLIPILETLFRQRYTPSFGIAAIVISPTRELAYQSFDVLRKLGRFHALSFGLAIGGMFLREEAKKMYTTNVVICTPGRLLQHFEQTPNFTADELKVLVLDEADKILDLGFAETLNSIVDALPKQRQTLLFSATQTKSIKSLARLSLKKPIYVSVHEKAKEVTPTTLNQRYIVCEMQDKVNMLWSFIKSHKMKKMLVFMSSCKEVRFVYQAFKKMHPGLTILCLHGHMKQLQRMEAYELFSRKRNCVMLATDVAARGLDFPVIHWVVQMDKPENVDTYIHRVGRTARYDQVGEALLMLMPSEEEKMVEDLKKRKIPVVKLKASRRRMFDVTKKLESSCAADHELKNNAQKAFLSVMKTLYILDRAAFNSVDVDAYAASLGLVQAPKLPFVSKAKASEKDKDDSSSDDDDDSEGESSVKKTLKASVATASVPAARKRTLDFSLGGDDDDEEEDDDIYNVIRDSKAHVENENEEEELKLVEEGKWAGRKRTTYKHKIKLLKQSKLVTFDEDGNIEGEADEDGEKGLNIDKAVQRLRQQDKIDKEVYRQRVKMEHREKRLKEKQQRREETMRRMGLNPDEDEGEAVAVIGNPEDGDDYEEDEEDDDDEGPQVKRRRMDHEEDDDEEDEDEDDDDSGEEDNDEDENGDSDGDDDMNADSGEDDDDDNENDDESEDEEEEDEDDDEDSHGDVEQDEAAVLALLGGKS